MLKLIKYEIRKNRNLFLGILAAIAALEIYFLLSLTGKDMDNTITAASLLAIAGSCTGVILFITGISSYSKELKQKSSYLIFMTPKSPLAIVASKLLFTLFIGLLFSALLAGLAAIDFPLLMDTYNQGWRGYYNLTDLLLQEEGISLTSLLFTIAFSVLTVFLQIISTVSVAYLAITLSATLLHGKRGRGLVSFLIFWAISWALSLIGNQFALDNLYLIEDTAAMTSALVPYLIQSVVVTILSLLGCSWMLKHKVNL